MKNCPVCRVDFSDDFAFCEFDGAILDKVIQEKKGFALFSKIKPQQRTFQLVAFGAAIALISIIIFGKTIPNRKPPVAKPTEIAAVEASPYIQTPQAAQEYVETNTDGNPPDSDSEQDKQNRHNNDPEKPGVTVSIPDARSAKNSQPKEQSKSVEEVTAPEPRVPPAQNNRRVETPPQTIEQPPRQANRPTLRTPEINHRGSENDDIASQPAVHSGNVNLSLVRVRSFRTETGIRYDLTLNMHQQEGRVIRWERLNLSTHSQSGISHTEVVPFSQRLGTSGSLSFTVSVEMRGRGDSDWQGRITCTGIGTDVEGRNVKTNLTARVTP